MPEFSFHRQSLRQWFTPITIERGLAYHASGNVIGTSVHRSGNGHVVTGLVRGNRAAPYRVEVGIWVVGPRWEIDSECTCPVGYDCKHAVAVLAAISGQQRTVQPAWQRDLTSALEDLERNRLPAATTDLALVVDLSDRKTWGSESRHSLSLRPVRRGKNGRWVKTGASWTDLRYSAAYGGDFHPSQVAAFAAMSSVFLQSYSNQNPQVLLLNDLLWPLLRRCADVGVELVPGTSLVSVDVIAPQRVTTDARRVGDALEVRTGLVVDDEWWPEVGREVAFIGTPAHGVALFREVADPDPRRSKPQYAVSLAPLTHPVEVSTQRLVATPVAVPADQVSVFERDYLPRLRRQLAVTSLDGSVELPEPARPRLELTITWHDTRTAETGWAWRYDERRYSMSGTDGMLQERDIVAEAAILDDLQLDDPALCDVAGNLLPRRTWVGRDVIELATVVAPNLRLRRDAGELDLVEIGTQRDYRPAESDPQITFDLADGEDSSTDWLDLSITITVDGESVPLGGALTALTRGDELIFTESGRHIPASHPVFEQLADLVAAAGELVDQPTDRVRVARYDVSMWNELEALGVVGAQAEQWMRSARALRDFAQLPSITATALTSEPRSYQQVGINWLAFLWQSGLGGILADDMGLGKTLQALTLVAHAREHGADPFLVVAPTSVVTAWVEQVRTHVPDLEVRTVTASEARRETSLADLRDGADVVITTYTLFRLEYDQYAELSWGGLLLDEAQHVKNHQSKTYHAVRRLEVPFKLALTGTPFENRLMELWALLSIVAPGLYSSPTRFKQSVVRFVEQLGDPDSLDRFRRRIRPFLLRRTKEQVADDLPPKQEQIVSVELSPKHRKIYDTHLQRERQSVLGLVEDFDRNRIAIFSALTRLRQLSLDPGLVDSAYDAVGSAKLDLVVEHLTEIVAGGHQVLVFSQFTGFLKRVRTRLEEADITLAYLDGRTRRRDVAIDRFRSGDASVFLISLKAGSVGLTLTEADYVYVLDPWWNPAAENQAVDRAHRIGQKQHVMVYRLVSASTIEEKVLALKERKAELFARVLDGDGAMSAELTAADVTALFES